MSVSSRTVEYNLILYSASGWVSLFCFGYVVSFTTATFPGEGQLTVLCSDQTFQLSAVSSIFQERAEQIPSNRRFLHLSGDTDGLEEGDFRSPILIFERLRQL